MTTSTNSPTQPPWLQSPTDQIRGRGGPEAVMLDLLQRMVTLQDTLAILDERTDQIDRSIDALDTQLKAVAHLLVAQLAGPNP